MIIIKELAERIEDELEGAADYAELAEKYKGHHDHLSAMYAEIAQQEMTHVDKLHTMVVGIIAKWREQNGAPPRQMERIWEKEHKSLMKRAAEVRALIDQIRK
jgi:rubrerythrin